MPPFVPNTSGVKVPISTFITLWLYLLFFSFSCLLIIIIIILIIIIIILIIIIMGKCVTKVTKPDVIYATYAINTYREPARLYIVGGQELRSSEGTTQGDPLAMSLYAISLQPP